MHPASTLPRRLKPELHRWDLFPQVLRAGAKTTITLAPRHEHARFKPDRRYEMAYYATDAVQGGPWKPTITALPFVMEDGAMKIDHTFDGEQEHILVLEEIDGEKRKKLGTFHLYSVEEDLLSRRPWRGDFHMHTFHSDGLQSPAYVSAACRGIGLDFMAITDHHKYEPSLEAMRTWEKLPIDLKLFPGEEIHPPGNPTHMINFGGRFSVNALLAGEDYKREVAARQAKLPALPKDADPQQFASCAWVFDKVREAGGLALFCHPFWFAQNQYRINGGLVDALYEHQIFDMVEILGGFHRHELDSNTLQVARYHDARARGKKVPIVGVSDCHDREGELHGWYATLVFSKGNSFDELKESILDLYSVALETVPGDTPHAYGPFRLVRYALFLMREVLPQHDALCEEEGRWMMAHVEGDPIAESMLKAFQGRTARLYDKLFSA